MCAQQWRLMGAEICSTPRRLVANAIRHHRSRDHCACAARPMRCQTDAPVCKCIVRAREQDDYDISFYGSSFMPIQFGAKVQELNETEEGVTVQCSFDLDQLEHIPAVPGVSSVIAAQSVWRRSNPGWFTGVLIPMYTLHVRSRPDALQHACLNGAAQPDLDGLAMRTDNWALACQGRRKAAFC